MRSTRHARETNPAQAGPPKRRTLARLLLTVLGAAALVLAAPTPALAQPALWASSPEDGSTLDAAPGEIALTFSETLDGALSEVTVTGPDQAPIELDAPRFSDNVLIQPMRYTVPGAYTVTVGAAFESGDALESTFGFSVESIPDMLVNGAPEGGAEAADGAEPDTAAEESDSNLVLGIALLAAVVVTAGGIALVRLRDQRRRRELSG
ncbi:copper resistance CopC family protein [Glycomyces dulcitolivorans]|uniref:copper resistance CopC family protein n=1 Tax=Glycomyces dulcitolivorans TaxID=2200759 RepID=UPI000DD31397|nr:copper resistance CopC family protein [Glycomyces dulcitolivorans]